MKEKHLKMMIDRLMLVPRKPEAGGEHTPIDHAGAKLPHGDESFLESGDEKISDLMEHKMHDHGLEKVIDRDTLPGGDSDLDDEPHATKITIGMVKVPDEADPGKAGNLSSYDHEKKVKMERARHAKIFGSH